MRVRKAILILLSLALLGGAALANAEEAEGLRVYAIEVPDTGERMLLTVDALTEAPLSLVTELPAAFPESGEPQAREAALRAVEAEYPLALLLFANAEASGARSVGVIAREMGGTALVAGDRIISRSFTYGAFLLDGRLTIDGARMALALHRPEAEIRELEPDDDDARLYEGEAFVDGVEYEFELDARTGKLLEWERD